MGFIIFLVIQTTKAEIDLVSNTYYEDELGYDARKLALERTLPFAHQLKYKVEDEFVTYSIPAPESSVAGTITFRHPRHEELDVSYSFTEKDVIILREKLDDEVPYNVVIKYSCEQLDYRIETKLILL